MDRRILPNNNNVFKGSKMSKDIDLTNNNFPRVMVFSHNCFSKSGSNGRTLGNFFINWPKEALAQFYIYNEIPDSSVCDNYFRVTDNEALKAFFKGNRVGRRVQSKSVIEDNETVLLKNLYKRHRKKKSLNFLARNLIWESNRWRSEEFTNWIDEFNPEVLLWQVGDYAFMLNLVLKIAEERNIPLILYNSEDYYFRDKKSLSLIHHLYRSQYKKAFEKLMVYVSHTVYICDMLQETYNERFNHKSTVLMTSTSMLPLDNKKEKITFVVSYLGNLGLGRHEPLIEIANSLQQIDSNLYLDVYGKILDEVVENEMKNSPGVRYKGVVTYEEVVSIMQESDLIVHAENFSDFYQKDMKHAFSTKIADSLASGTCFFVYAPEYIAFTKYLKNNNAAYVVTNKNNLNESLESLINDSELRQTYINTALQIANRRHNLDHNAIEFENILFDMLRK